MANAIRVFVDTSVWFSAIWSSEGGSRLILKLGEAGAIELLISAQVLSEIDSVIKRKAPDLLPLVALLIDQSKVRDVKTAAVFEVEQLLSTVGHPGDAQIVADAVSGRADVLVTLDKMHLLGNRGLAARIRCTIQSPGEFLQWYRKKLS